MRLYFHLQNGTETIRDEDGIDVSDLDAAKAEALNTIQDIRDEQDGQPHDWSAWKLAVVDGSGALLLSLNLDTCA